MILLFSPVLVPVPEGLTVAGGFSSLAHQNILPHDAVRCYCTVLKTIFLTLSRVAEMANERKMQEPG